MYNYYKHQNLLNLIEKEDSENNQAKKILELKEKKNKNMIENYELRVKQFVFKMANRNFTISNKSKLIVNSKEDYLKENSNKILAGKGFCFSKHITDKERLNKLQEEKEDIRKCYEAYLNNKKYNNENDFTKIENNEMKKSRSKSRKTSLLGLIDKSMNKNIRNKKIRFSSVIKNKDEKNSSLAFKPELLEPNENYSYLMYTHMKRKALLEQNGIHGKFLDQEDAYLNYEKTMRDISKQIKKRNIKKTDAFKSLGKTHFNAASDIALNKSLYNNEMLKKLQSQLEENKQKEGKLGFIFGNTNYTFENYLKQKELINENNKNIIKDYKKKLKNVDSKYLNVQNKFYIDEAEPDIKRLSIMNKTFNMKYHRNYLQNDNEKRSRAESFNSNFVKKDTENNQEKQIIRGNNNKEKSNVSYFFNINFYLIIKE
jgi:hypothetical protein